MEPTIKEINTTKTLTHPILVNGKTINTIELKSIIIRPILKRIVALTTELDRVIIYEGETVFETHKNDSDESLIAAFLTKIDTMPHA